MILGKHNNESVILRKHNKSVILGKHNNKSMILKKCKQTEIQVVI